MHPCIEIFGCVISFIDSSSFVNICFSVISFSLILAKRLIASLKHYKRILEIWLQLLFSNLEVRFSAIWGGRKTKDLVVYVKVNWYPLTSVWDQCSPKLSSTLFAGSPYAWNRSLDWDLFFGGSSARLPSMSHAHKIDSHPGIIIYATSQKLKKNKKKLILRPCQRAVEHESDTNQSWNNPEESEKLLKLSSSSLLYSQCFSQYVIWPSSGVSCWTQEPT